MTTRHKNLFGEPRRTPQKGVRSLPVGAYLTPLWGDLFDKASNTLVGAGVDCFLVSHFQDCDSVFQFLNV